MILRSRKVTLRELPSTPTTPSTPRPRKISASPKTPSSELRVHRRKRLRSCADENEETPSVPIKRPSKWAKNKRKRSDVKGLEETPVRDRAVRVHFRVDEPLLMNPDPSDFYSPLINFFSPRNGGPGLVWGPSPAPSLGENDQHPRGRLHRPDFPPSLAGHRSHTIYCCSPPMQKVRRKCPKPEEVPYFSELPIDDTEINFSSHAFMCTLPPPSESPCVSRKDIPFKTRSAPESTLVLDLDDTLVHCTLTPLEDAEFTFQIQFQDIYYKVYMKLRPHVKEFLETLSKMYEMFVFTTAKREYAEKILDVLDPQRKLIRHRLFQEDCSCFLGHYIKNLNVLQRDLAKTIILDNAAHTCPYQNLNRIPVKSWLRDSSDKELLHLIPVLEEMTQVEDVRTEISRKYHGGELLAEF